MKKCTKCGKKKPLIEFYKEAKSKDGHKSQCIACMRAYAKDLYNSRYTRRHVPVDIRQAYFVEVGVTESTLDRPTGLTHRETLELFASILRMGEKTIRAIRRLKLSKAA